MFIAAEKYESAGKILGYIKNSFMQSNGDFNTTPDLKSIKQEYTEYWSYTNGCILRAAFALNMQEIIQPAYDYLRQFNAKNDAGFLTNNPKDSTNITDVLTAAHHGLLNLEMGNIEIAISAGNYLSKAFEKQTNIKNGLYLRSSNGGDLITSFEKDKNLFYFVSTQDADQLYFMVGYPSAFLALLYKKTADEKFLNFAIQYLDFSLSCNQSIYQSNFSHKIAWAASILYEITKDKRYLDAIEKITTHFIENQSEVGIWYTDHNTTFDQSPEIACWFLNIARNLSSAEKEFFPKIR